VTLVVRDSELLAALTPALLEIKEIPEVHELFSREAEYIAFALLPTVRKIVADELRAEREAVLQALVRHGQGEMNLYDEIGHGAHR